MIAHFFKDSAVYAFFGILSRGLSLILLPFYTRILSPVEYGVFDLIITFGALVNLTVALEISQGMARYFSGEENPDKKVSYASTGLWFAVGAYTLFLIVTELFSSHLSRLIMGREGLEGVFRIGMVFLWLNCLFILIQNQFRWEHKSPQYAVTGLIMTVSTAIIALTLTYGFGLKVEGILIGMSAGAFLGILYGLSRLRHSFQCRFNFQRLREMLLFSLPLVPSSISVFISYYIDRILIRHYLSLDDVGLYGVGFRIASIAGFIIISFQGALVPLIFANYRKPETPSHLAIIFRLFVAASLLLTMGITLFSQEILMIMTVPQYYAASSVILFLTPAILLSNMYIFAPGIDIERKTHLILAINISGCLLNIMLNMIMIPRFGIQGAAGATLLGYIAIFVSYMILSQKYYPVPHNWHVLGLSVAAAITIAFTGTHIDFGFWEDILIKSGLLVLGIIVFSTVGLVSKQERSDAMGFIKTKLGIAA